MRERPSAPSAYQKPRFIDVHAQLPQQQQQPSQHHQRPADVARQRFYVKVAMLLAAFLLIVFILAHQVTMSVFESHKANFRLQHRKFHPNSRGVGGDGGQYGGAPLEKKTSMSRRLEDDGDGPTFNGDVSSFPPYGECPAVDYELGLLSHLEHWQLPTAAGGAGGVSVQRSYAYVTYVTTPELVHPAAVLMYSISRTGSRYSRVVLVADGVGVSDDDIAFLSFFARIIVVRNNYRAQNDFRHTQDLNGAILCWSLTEYAKVMFISVNEVIVVRNMDDAFDVPEVGLVEVNFPPQETTRTSNGNNNNNNNNSSGGVVVGQRQRFQDSIVVLSPSAAMFDRVVRVANKYARPQLTIGMFLDDFIADSEDWGVGVSVLSRWYSASDDDDDDDGVDNNNNNVDNAADVAHHNGNDQSSIAKEKLTVFDSRIRGIALPRLAKPWRKTAPAAAQQSLRSSSSPKEPTSHAQNNDDAKYSNNNQEKAAVVMNMEHDKHWCAFAAMSADLINRGNQVDEFSYSSFTDYSVIPLSSGGASGTGGGPSFAWYSLHSLLLRSMARRQHERSSILSISSVISGGWFSVLFKFSSILSAPSLSSRRTNEVQWLKEAALGDLKATSSSSSSSSSWSLSSSSSSRRHKVIERPLASDTEGAAAASMFVSTLFSSSTSSQRTEKEEDYYQQQDAAGAGGGGGGGGRGGGQYFSLACGVCHKHVALGFHQFECGVLFLTHRKHCDSRCGECFSASSVMRAFSTESVPLGGFFTHQHAQYLRIKYYGAKYSNPLVMQDRLQIFASAAANSNSNNAGEVNSVDGNRVFAVDAIEVLERTYLAGLECQGGTTSFRCMDNKVFVTHCTGGGGCTKGCYEKPHVQGEPVSSYPVPSVRWLDAPLHYWNASCSFRKTLTASLWIEHD